VKTNSSNCRGWLFYDGECSLCTGAAARFQSFLNRHGFEIVPLQTNSARECLGLKANEVPDEMKLLTDAGKIFGGADALMQIARRIWWAWPLFALAQIPGAMIFARLVYRRIAANRHCLNGICRIQEKGKI
jgi:predicted DCC family thiol-disulfide oxidoreductase YuxK